MVRDLSKIVDLYQELRENAGKQIEILSKRDGRRFVGTIPNKLGRIYIKYPKVHLIFEEAVVHHGGRERRHKNVHIPLDPFVKDFEYKILDGNCPALLDYQLMVVY
jgi:hypothetical protein